MQGIGVEEDEEKGFQWIHEAALQEDVDALYLTGLCYQEGMGVEADLDEARDWYERAAELGDKRSKKALKKLK